MIKTITQGQLRIKNAQAERLTLIDASSQEQYERAHLPRAIQLPAKASASTVRGYLPTEGTEIIVYAESPESDRADSLARYLYELGFPNIYVYRGGLREWIASGLSIESIKKVA